MTPKITVITINYNDLNGLKKTVASTSVQSCKNFEHIIIDGGSSDGSAAFIRDNDNLFSYAISEPDTGVYNAMNKGIKAAKGDYLFFLNSGDEFKDDSVLSVFLEKTKSKKDIYYGDIHLVDGKGKSELSKTPQKLTFEFFFRRTIPHQAAIIKRSLFDTIFYYDESLKIVSDWEFFVVAICKNNCSYEHVGISVANYDTNGISSVQENKERYKEERLSCLNKHFPAFIDDYKAYRKQNRLLKSIPYHNLTQLLKIKRVGGFTKLILKILNNIFNR